jgi:hypothetical protein
MKHITDEQLISNLNWHFKKKKYISLT